jgi:hypothetical protein
MDAMDKLRIYTARDRSGGLIGYAVYTLAPNLHYGGCLQASQDVLFVVKAARHGTMGTRLILYSEAGLRADGTQIIVQHVKLAHNFGPLLVRLGYQAVDTMYSKRLDRE